jgi:hypothetical protein
MLRLILFVGFSVLTFFVLGWLSGYELWHERTVAAIAVTSCIVGAIVAVLGVEEKAEEEDQNG